MRAVRGRGEPGRVACPHYPDCVGCPWVGTPYTTQIRAKQETLRAALAKQTALGEVLVPECIGSPRAFGYRNHAKLVFRSRRGGEVLLGVYRPGTHSVAPAHGCIVHDRLLQPVLRELRRHVEEMGIPIFDERRRSRELRYALVRGSRDQARVHLTLVAARERPAWSAELLRRLRSGCPSLGAVFLCVNPTPGNALLTEDIRRLFGAPVLLERFGEVLLESSPAAFVQANPAVASRIYASAARFARLGPGDDILDLYCGVGAIGLSLPDTGGRLLGIESATAAVECAQHNARRLGRTRASFVAAPVEDATDIARQHGVPSPAVVSVNPPRKGLGADVVALLDRLGPRRLLYVSCDPVTLARDLNALRGRGFEVELVQGFDMLPQTPHVEALAVLSRRARRDGSPGSLDVSLA